MVRRISHKTSARWLCVSHVSFYRKWRPQTFEEVIGQERVTRTLQNAITSHRIVHAYLFCGHRGTGKTTAARILAKCLNCERGPLATPCNQCANCRAINAGASLDVIEIDAASNRGIDEIRDLREKVKLVPVEGRYKVYIIDEAHMLTAEAANALLKTLEEPPAHAVLVLVTTEPHRLPTTITSRTQRFDFKRIPLEAIVRRLRSIASSEGFAIDDEALHLIARSADGAQRDAESLLDQLSAFSKGPITRADVRAVLGVIEEEVAQEIADAVIDGDAARCLELVGRTIDEGRDIRQVLRSLVEHFRDLLIVAVVPDPAEIVETTETRLAALRTQSARLSPSAIAQKIRLLAAAEADARSATQPRVVLEMALLRASRPEMDPSLEGVVARLDALERQARLLSPPPVAAPGGSSTAGEPEARVRQAAAHDATRSGAPAPPPSPPAGERGPRPRRAQAPASPGVAAAGPAAHEDGRASAVTLDVLREKWGQVMTEVKQRTRTVHAFLLESAPQRIEGTDLILAVRHRFHLENLQDEKHRRVVEEALARVSGVPLRLRLILDEAVPAPEDALPEPTLPGRDVLVEEAVRRFGSPVQEIRRLE
jgi:DNA polymerase III subunit gamma/tau